MKKNNSGYVLVLTLMMLSLLVVVVTSMFYNQTAHQAISRTVIDREKAKMLCLSGIQLAMSKLYIEPEKKKEQAQKGQQEQKSQTEQKEKKTNESKHQTNFLKRLLSILNKFSTIKLTESIDQVDATIKYCISCEDGKIDINKLFDYSIRKFIGGKAPNDFDAAKFLQEVFKRIEQLTGQKNIFGALTKFLQARKFPLNDVTELLTVPEFYYFKDKVFFQMPDDKTRNDLFLTDVFTIWSDSGKIQPWLLSSSLINILELRKEQNLNDKVIDEWLKKFKPNTDWKSEWNKILQPVYKKEFTTLFKGIEKILDPEFSPKTFSVVSYATVGQLTQRCFAYLELDEQSIPKLKKLYWL